MGDLQWGIYLAWLGIVAFLGAGIHVAGVNTGFREGYLESRLRSMVLRNTGVPAVIAS